MGVHEIVYTRCEGEECVKGYGAVGRLKITRRLQLCGEQTTEVSKIITYSLYPFNSV